VARAHTFGRYRVTKTLGAGAMGEVYEAVDDVLGREVAIKTLRGESGVTARFIDDRFRNEARAIAQFSHPGVVQVFDIDLSADPPYLVMERVSGPSLAERIKQAPLPPAELVALGIQIARALAAAHGAGVVHRDVKPANILGAGAAWKLADFGVAHVPDSSLTMTGQFVGSPAYAPPEALVKGVSAPAGDVYGLGATLYEAAVGRWPRKEAQGALLAPVPPLAQLAPHVPAHVAHAIDRAIAMESAQRPTANELADLLAAVAHDAVPAGAATPPRGVAVASAPRALRWQPWAIGGAIVLVIVIAIAMRGDKQASPSLAPPVGPALGTPAGPPLDHVEVHYPPNLGGKSGRDFERVVDKIYKQDFDAALRELDKWEDKYGKRDETIDLRDQLQRVPHDTQPDEREE
jgi:tRNA A-37 threonylcarbamoyl transferase component Bud32